MKIFIITVTTKLEADYIWRMNATVVFRMSVFPFTIRKRKGKNCLHIPALPPAAHNDAKLSL